MTFDEIDLIDFTMWEDELITFEIENGCNPWLPQDSSGR